MFKVLEKIRVSTLIVLLLFAGTLSRAQTSSPYENELRLFEDWVPRQMAVDRIPGLSVGFYLGDFIWARGFGFADLENDIAATELSSYRLASNTKSMTAVAVLQLAERDKIDLDAEVQRYVPYFPRKEWPVKVRQLLGHLGGISHYRNYEQEGHIKEHKSTREAIAIFEDFDLVVKPGTQYNYTSYGYNLLGAVVEGASKQSYGEYLRENLWRPVGMDDTHMDDPDVLIENRVRGYRLLNDELKNSEFIDISSRFAGGGTRSTVLDLLNYARSLDTDEVLSEKSREFMFTSMRTENGYYTDYGAGWRVAPVNGRFHVQHTGSQAETRTLLLKFPQEDFALAIAYNFEGASAAVYARRLIQLIFDEGWNVAPFTGETTDDAFYTCLSEVFNYGLGYYDRHGKPKSEDLLELTSAFDFFNRCVNRDSLEENLSSMRRLIRAGRHPVKGDAFVVLGSYMAAQLAGQHGSVDMEKYHSMGALSFFDDYVTLYTSSASVPETFQFEMKTEKTIDEWREDWRSAYSREVRQLALSAFGDWREASRTLKKSFSGAEVYPDYLNEFSDAVNYYCRRGEKDEALRIAETAAALYPQSAAAQVNVANVYAYFGEAERARTQYLQARDKRYDDDALSIPAMNRLANELLRSGKLKEAVALLEIGLELFPDTPRFYATMAEVHITRGREILQKALEMDPTFLQAQERLKQIR